MPTRHHQEIRAIPSQEPLILATGMNRTDQASQIVDQEATSPARLTLLLGTQDKAQTLTLAPP
jgi:hypothetical protein